MRLAHRGRHVCRGRPPGDLSLRLILHPPPGEILSFHKTAMKEQGSLQSTLFVGSSLKESAAELVLRDAPVATKREKLMWEKELLGLYVSDHPFREYAEYFGESLAPISKIPELKTVSASLIVGGIISSFKKIMTKKGAEMAFMDIEDEFDSIEVVVFPKTFEKYKTVLNPDAPILIQGKFEEKDGEPKIILEQVYELKKDNLQNLKDILKMSSGGKTGSKESAEAMQDSAEIGILVPKTMPQAFADELKKVFVEFPGNRRVVLVVEEEGGRKKIPTSFSIAFSGDSVKAIENLVGRNSIVNMDVKV
jgi:DNA polymerase-3 subunit alpha